MSCWVLILTVNHNREAVHAGQCVRVLEAEHLFAELQHLPMHLLGCLILALAIEHTRKFAHAGQCAWVLRAQYLPTELQHLLMHLLRRRRIIKLRLLRPCFLLVCAA